MSGYDSRSSGQLVVDGFDVLRDVDTNKDGKIDASDSVFANLRIWHDSNQDGIISQANEFTTLSANSIVLIEVDSTTVRIDLGNGNGQTAASSFTHSDFQMGRSAFFGAISRSQELLILMKK